MDYKAMSVAQLAVARKKLKEEAKSVNKAIAVRGEFLKANMIKGKKWITDPEYCELKEKKTMIDADLKYTAELWKAVSKEQEVRERKAQLVIDELDVREREVEDIKEMKANERRPDGTELQYLYEFDSLKGAKRRLVVMMIREIGLQRFLELRRIASWDERHRNNAYYGNSLTRR